MEASEMIIKFNDTVNVKQMNEKRKIIYDLVHGYIEIDKDVEGIINSASFQRLKHISQLTAQHLFPCANHTRFEHSLGVMKLAIDAYIQIKDDLKNFIMSGKSIEEREVNQQLDFICLHLKYAALLHDIGHAPLSHVGEALYDKKEILDKIGTILHYDENNSPLAEDAAPHELMSCYIVLKKFRGVLKEIFKKNKIENFDVEFILRIITGAKYKDKKYWDRNLIISLVNGKAFDVDKMDYLMRDNQMTGNVGGYIDSQRILCSLKVANKRTLSFGISALSSLKKLVDCRDSLYMWVYNHHIVVYTDYMYSQCLKHFISLKKDPNLFPEENYIEAIDRNELFSCEAIAERYITDNEIYAHINTVIDLMRKNKVVHPVTKALVTHLTGRNFLKASWKTLFEYKKFLDEFPPDIKKQIPNLFQNDDYLRKIQTHIKETLHIEDYEWAIVKRNNKFYNELIQELYIYKEYIDRKEKFHELGKLLPIQDYSEIYDNVAFYIFANKDKIEEIKKEVIKYINDDTDN